MELMTIIYIVAIIWSTPWTGLAMWKAGARGEKKWFTALLLLNILVLNLLGIIPMFYLFFKRDKKQKPVQQGPREQGSWNQ